LTVFHHFTVEDCQLFKHGVSYALLVHEISFVNKAG